MEWTKRDIKKRIKHLCKEYKLKVKFQFTDYSVNLLLTYHKTYFFRRLPMRRLKNKHYKGELNLQKLEYAIIKILKGVA